MRIASPYIVAQSVTDLQFMVDTLDRACMHEVGNGLQCHKDKNFVTLCIGLEANADYPPFKLQAPR